MISPYIVPGISHSKDRIIKKIANIYGLDVEDLYKRTRETRIVEPRQIAISILKYACKMDIREISIEFNQTDANIVHARKCVMNFYQTDNKFRKRVNEIMESLFPFCDERKKILSHMMDPNMDKAKQGMSRKSKVLFNN